MKKTIREWLEELPEPYRSQAMENMIKKAEGLKKPSFQIALTNAFVWELSKQGGDYWRKLYNRLPYMFPEAKTVNEEAVNKSNILHCILLQPLLLFRRYPMLKNNRPSP